MNNHFDTSAIIFEFFKTKRTQTWPQDFPQRIKYGRAKMPAAQTKQERVMRCPIDTLHDITKLNYKKNCNTNIRYSLTIKFHVDRAPTWYSVAGATT
jgi:hypothetical protein